MKLQIIKKFLLILIKFISLLPFIQSILQLFYLYGVKRLKKYALETAEILDIIITSDTTSKDFVYGQSDYNLLIIVSDQAHPKKILKQLRAFLKSHLITNLVFHTQYMPIVTTRECKSEALKSFLMRRSRLDKNHLRSIFGSEEYTANLEAQNHYSTLHSAFKSLNFSLFRDRESKTKRSKVKNIYRSIWTLANHYPRQFFLKPQYIKRSLLLLKYPILAKILYRSFEKLSWQAIRFDAKEIKSESRKELPLPPKMEGVLLEKLELPFLNDITLTPSIIQNSSEKLYGKLFIDLIVNENIAKTKHLKQLRELEEDLLSLQTTKLKFRVKAITQASYQLQLEQAFFTFPLESHYRNLETISLKKNDYTQKVDHACLVRSATHFLVSQFLRFRSSEQKTSLIGSKFVKSLNLMFRYYQLHHFLVHKDFLNYRSENQIREVLTPQFSHLALNDQVSEDDWPLIRAQLLYLLKQIRKHLLSYDPGLKELSF